MSGGVKPVPAEGQEWEKAHCDGPSSPPTRIRIVAIIMADLEGTPVRAWVQSQLPGNRWGRLRSMSLKALTNAPKGYRLVKEA